MTVEAAVRDVAFDRYAVRPTPLLDLSELAPDGVSLFGKAEWHLPTGSVKDRVATLMIGRALADGSVGPETHLLEPSSGNTGIALARIARIEGVALTVVAPDNISRERISLLESFGANIVFSPGAEGSNGAVRHAERLAEDPGFSMLNQYANRANPDAHQLTTGPEIIDDLDALGLPRLDAFVATLGTGGTLTGTARALRPRYPDIEIVAAEPPTGELISGLRSLADGFIPAVFDPTQLDRKILVRTRDSIVLARRVLEELGWFVGPSSGAALHASLRVASRLSPGSVVVTVLPDAGWKYLSTGLFTGSVDDAADGVVDTTLW